MVTIVFPLEIITPKKRYSPVGTCIYCDKPEGRIEDEHIVPFGLAGDSVVLPKASCRRCARITGKVEHFCLRSTLGNFRIAIGAPTRRPKDRPKSIAIRTGRLSEDAASIADIQTVTISSTELVMYPSFTFPGAGTLEGRSVETDVSYQVNLHRLQGQFEEFSRKHGAIESPLLLPMAFLRMIAKIAHSYAVAELGLGGFRPYLLELILCRIQELNQALQWIGCEPQLPPSTADLFSLTWNKVILADGRRLVIVHIRLFPFFGTPHYHLVVGEWDS
jgi:hypothetical protein